MSASKATVTRRASERHTDPRLEKYQVSSSTPRLKCVIDNFGKRKSEYFLQFLCRKIPTHIFRDFLNPPGGCLCCCVACIIHPTKRIQHNGIFLMAPFIATSDCLCLPDPHNHSGTPFHKAYWSLGTDEYLHIHSTPDVTIFIRLRNTANESTHRPLYHS